ncbi:MAG: 30S ribosomal protein S17 [Spirochaetaceae bacterium]
MEKKSNKKLFTGVVESNKMEKTIVVRVTTKVLHPLYKKYVTRSKKYMAHDENSEAGMGDTVKIIESRPMSKNKKWTMTEIVEKAK